MGTVLLNYHALVQEEKSKDLLYLAHTDWRTWVKTKSIAVSFKIKSRANSVEQVIVENFTANESLATFKKSPI